MSNSQKQDNALESHPCPECDTPLSAKNKKEGDLIECQACGCECEILNINPLKISLLEEEK